MNDNQLFTLVRSTLLAAMPARGLNGWKVARKYQTQQQGANSTPTVYVFKLLDKRHGSPQESNAWDEGSQTLTTTESQVYETSFQASVLVDESTDANALTPSDCLNIVCAIMQASATIAALEAAGVGILRVGQVLNPYDVNDRGQFQAGPSFDFVLTYRRTRTYVSPRVVAVEGSINRV